MTRDWIESCKENRKGRPRNWKTEKSIKKAEKTQPVKQKTNK